MSNSLRGMIAGLVATIVLSVVMELKASMGLWPELSLIQLLSNLGSITPVQAWMDHFIIGVVIWGLAFGAFDALNPTMAYWLKGIILGVGAWLIMMVAFMPLAKVGFFGSKVGASGALVTLGYHLLYGLILGVSYGLLTIWAPAKTQT
jgi:hypothetical protein